MGPAYRISAGFAWDASVSIGTADLTYFQFGESGLHGRDPRVGFRCVVDPP
jgi:hypothetical protein